MNIQPVVPITLDADWHVISRTIFPVMLSQDDLFPGAGSQSGIRDTTEGLYFSPSRTFHGFTWGVGPIFLLPTGTDELLGAGVTRNDVRCHEVNRDAGGPVCVVVVQDVTAPPGDQRMRAAILRHYRRVWSRPGLSIYCR